MIKFHRYYPAYCSGFEAEADKEYTFNSMEELQQDLWINNFFKGTDKEVFHKWSVTESNLRYPYNSGEYDLMAEYNQGTLWRVVGHITGIELPKWESVGFEKWPKDPPPKPRTKEESANLNRHMAAVNQLFKTTYSSIAEELFKK